MNAVWNSYGQLCGCPEIFKKSCKFFCRELDIRVPKEVREISCHVIAHPRLMFQIANPTAEPVPFGKDGLPLASEARSPGRSPGVHAHGLGSRSIRAFCEKYGAICEYEQRDGQFMLRVIC